MIDSVALRWILTAAFAVLGMLYVVSSVRVGRAWTQRVSGAAHVVMCAAMIAMAWPWGMDIPVRPQVAVFALAALWFLLLARSNGTGTVRLYDLHHVVLMAAMAVMVGSMPTLMDRSGSEMPQAVNMPAHMSMPGMDGNSSGGVPGYLIAISIVLAGYFAVYTLWLISRTAGRRKTSLDSGRQGVMSLGMAVMLIAVL